MNYSLRQLMCFVSLIAIAFGVGVTAFEHQPYIIDMNAQVGIYNAYLIHSYSPRRGSRHLVLIFDKMNYGVTRAPYFGSATSSERVSIIPEGVFLEEKAISRWDKTAIIIVRRNTEDQLEFQAIPLSVMEARHLYVDNKFQIQNFSEASIKAIEWNLKGKIKR